MRYPKERKQAVLAGVSAAHVRRMAPEILGAELRQEAGAIRGRWYIPRSWAKRWARDHAKSKRERVLDAHAKAPGATSAEIAKAVGCSPSYARRVLLEEAD